MGVCHSQPRVVVLGPDDPVPLKHQLLLLDELTPCAHAAFRTSSSDTAVRVAVQIKQLSGANVAAELPQRSTLQQLKAAITELLPDAPPPERQRLLIGGRVLDGDPSSVVRLEKDAVIFITLAAGGAADDCANMPSAGSQPGQTSYLDHITHHRFAVTKAATVADVLRAAERAAEERWGHPTVARRVLITRANGESVEEKAHVWTLEGGMLWMVLDSAGPASTDELRRWVGRWCDGSKDGKEELLHIAEWNVSNITDMTNVFKDRRRFDDDISGWDTSQVTCMEYMFDKAVAFNQPIGEWDTSKVYSMSYMFSKARAMRSTRPTFDTKLANRRKFMHNLKQEKRTVVMIT